MTGAERGFLLLTCHLGIKTRKTLSVARFRELAQRVRAMERPMEDRDLAPEDLLGLGYDEEMAQRIVSLLSEEELLDDYLRTAAKYGCQPVTWISRYYPERIRSSLKEDAPGVLWLKGNPELLSKPAISLVGSRDLQPLNEAFAESVGRWAARKGYVLISGNARGADTQAQRACLEAGGAVISVVADDLRRKNPTDRIAYLSELDFDASFSSIRAHSRNRLIHCMGQKVFVARSGLSGGTWSGTEKNLIKGWSPVYIFEDGTDPVRKLQELGATPIRREEIGLVL